MWTFSVLNFDLIRDDLDSASMGISCVVYHSREEAEKALTAELQSHLDEWMTDDPTLGKLDVDIVWNDTEDEKWLEGYERNTEDTLFLYEVTFG